MKITTRRALFGGAIAITLAGGVGFAASALPAGAQMLPGGHGAMHGRGSDGSTVPGAGGMMPLGRGDRGDAGMMAGEPGAMHEEVLGSVATTLGVTPEVLRTELAGKSLADVAQAHGVDVATVKASILAAMQVRVDAAVAAGTLTAERAASMTTMMAGRIDGMLTQVGTMADREGPAMGGMNRGSMDHGGRGEGGRGRGVSGRGERGPDAAPATSQ